MKPGSFHIRRRQSAFTMVEIAICLAVIGLALVAIIGVLPLGMNVQRDNREETVIDQDGTVLLESIRNGVHAGTDLTNYVVNITNYWTQFGLPPGTTNQLGVNWYTYTGSYIFNVAHPDFALTNNARIIGLLSTPELTDLGLNPTNNILSGGYSNHIVATVYALSGPALEKPPQDNQLLVQSSFTYRIGVVNAPPATDTNLFGANVPQVEQAYVRQLAANLHELRLGFYWPVHPNGSLGLGRQTQRTMIAGGIFETNDDNNVQKLYFYQSQVFTNTP